MRDHLYIIQLFFPTGLLIYADTISYSHIAPAKNDMYMYSIYIYICMYMCICIHIYVYIYIYQFIFPHVEV